MSMETLIRSQRRAQAGRLAIAAAAAVVVSAASVGLLALSGWFLAGAALAGAAGAAAAHGFNFLLPSACIRLLAILRTGARYVERVSGHEAALKALAALRPALFASLAAARPETSLRLSSGEASARMIQDVDAVQNLFVRLSAPWGAGAGMATGLVLAASASPAAAGVVLAAVCATLGAGAVIGRRVADPAGREVQAATGRLKDELAALQACTAELRAYGLEPLAQDRVSARGQALHRAQERLALAGGWAGLAQASVMGAAVVGTIAVSLGEPAPTTALAALAAVTAVEAATALLTAWRQNGVSGAGVRRLTETADQPPGDGLTPEGAELDLIRAGLTLRPGKRLAVTGPSGAGKTTLVERLIGLRTGPGGEWMVGGRDAAACDPKSLARLVAYAPQDVRLLNGSVRENLTLGAPGASDADVWAALETAALGARVRAEAQGLSTPVGENGGRFSGGERRRLALARALLKPAPWLVLDEPTEGLDATTEAHVLAGLIDHLNRTGQGLILISHRPAPLALCQTRLEVVRLDGGRVRFAERAAPLAA